MSATDLPYWAFIQQLEMAALQLLAMIDDSDASCAGCRLQRPCFIVLRDPVVQLLSAHTNFSTCSRRCGAL